MNSEHQQMMDAIRNQKDYSDRHDVPHFAPREGICFYCHRNIYTGPQAYTPEYAAMHLITSCPYCNHTFCD